MIYSYGFLRLSVHIARFHCQSRTGGWAYSQDKNTCAETLAKNGKGLICKRGHIRGTLQYMYTDCNIQEGGLALLAPCCTRFSYLPSPTYLPAYML